MHHLLSYRSLTIALLVGLWGPSTGAAQPRIELEPDFLAFGVIPENETRLGYVTIRNTGTQVLRIREVQVTCPCTQPSLPVQELAPNESTVMEVLFNSMGFQGPQRKYLKIASNDPQRGFIDFPVTADIKVPLLMTPHQRLVSFAALRTGQTRSQTYAFHSEEVTDLVIEAQTWPREWLDIVMQPGKGPQHVEVVFTARPNGPVGRYRDTVRLTTNVPAVPTVSLEVDVRLVADLVLSMERVNLGVVPSGSALQARVQVTAHDSQMAFELTGAEIDIPDLQASIINEQNQSFAVIEGEALAAADPRARASQGRIQGTLRIFSNLESTPELQVPVTYIVRR